MSEAQDYFFAILDSELRSGKSPLAAIEIATNNYGDVFEITPQDHKEKPKESITPLLAKEVEGMLRVKNGEWFIKAKKIPKGWDAGTKVLIRKVEK